MLLTYLHLSLNDNHNCKSIYRWFWRLFLQFSDSGYHREAAQSHSTPGKLPRKYLETTGSYLIMSHWQSSFKLKHNSMSKVKCGFHQASLRLPDPKYRTLAECLLPQTPTHYMKLCALKCKVEQHETTTVCSRLQESKKNKQMSSM